MPRRIGDRDEDDATSCRRPRLGLHRHSSAASGNSSSATPTRPSNHGSTSADQLRSVPLSATVSSSIAVSWPYSGWSRSTPSIGGKRPRNLGGRRPGPRRLEAHLDVDRSGGGDVGRAAADGCVREPMRNAPTTTPMPTARTATMPMTANRHAGVEVGGLGGGHRGLPVGSGPAARAGGGPSVRRTSVRPHRTIGSVPAASPALGVADALGEVDRDRRSMISTSATTLTTGSSARGRWIAE